MHFSLHARDARRQGAFVEADSWGEGPSRACRVCGTTNEETLGFCTRRQMRGVLLFLSAKVARNWRRRIKPPKSTLAPVRGTIPARPVGRLLAGRAVHAGKCNAPGCTKVTKCHLPKVTRCAPLQASSRRPVYNYTFLFSFLLSSLFFSSFIISRPPALSHVRTNGAHAG
jgi:hypothetical protein